MKNLLLDIWHDLRARRLWPVALVLVAGLVAVPVLLAKKPEAAVPPPAPAAEAEAPAPDGPAELTEVKLEDLGQGSGSSLSSFDDPSNPFAPPRKVMERIRAEAEGVDTVDNAVPGGGGGKEIVEGGSLGGGSGADSGDAGGDTGGTPDTGETPETPDTPGDDGGETTTTNFSYVVDVTFRSNDRRRRIKALEKLDILPDRASPLLIFLGVTANAGNAVFLVDSTLQAAGEGRCKPSNSECAFLYLGPGSEHEFTNDDGDSYTLRVNEIRRVEIGAGGKKAGASKKGSDKKQIAGAALEQPSARRRFSVPLLADVVSVSSGEEIDSNSDPDRR
jgi:hypothetical protein